MNERENFILDNIVDAKVSNEKADAITKEKENKLKKSLAETKALVAQKLNSANENSRNLTEQAKQKSKNDIKSAKEALIQEAERNRQDLNIEDIADVIYTKILEQS